MNKIDLHLEFNKIRERIEIDKSVYKPGRWAESIGVSKTLVSNIHGKSKRQYPPLPYVFAVSKFTGKPIEWYLYGDKPAADALIAEPRAGYQSGSHRCPFCGEMSEEIKDLCKKVKDILESGQSVIVDALKSNIEAFQYSVNQADEIRKLKETVNHHTKLLEADTSPGTGKDASTGTRRKKM